ncbi:hypothetical protein [Glaciibacter psychrotolerans]|uniref:Uncharacterized protein n=1 Tax=Glaciibacter psychrotolerans TaxID=670054 RepID=A0A7Z0ECK1_9MICO|nr:hypothetical protein [Leifsonia psychrotolerans]NYJ19173.1 hypothetical protein [Leifsonia psychrotolerans]
MNLTESDLAFAVFLETRQKWRVVKEQFEPTIRTTLTRAYDNETKKLQLIGAAANNTKESK